MGDRFTILKRGRTFGTFTKAELSRDEMVRLMSGADELDVLSDELERFAQEDVRGPKPELSAIEHRLAQSLEGEEA